MVKQTSNKCKDIKTNTIESHESAPLLSNEVADDKPLTIECGLDKRNDYLGKNKTSTKRRNTPPQAKRGIRQRTNSGTSSRIDLERSMSISETLFNSKLTLKPQTSSSTRINGERNPYKQNNNQQYTKSFNGHSRYANRLCANIGDRKILGNIKMRQQTINIPNKRETSDAVSMCSDIHNSRLNCTHQNKMEGKNIQRTSGNRSSSRIYGQLPWDENRNSNPLKSGKKPLFEYSSDNSRIIGPAKSEEPAKIKTYPTCKNRVRIRTSSINEHVERYRRGISPKMRIGPRTYLEMQKKKEVDLRYSMYPTPPYMYMYKERYCDLLKNNYRVQCIETFTRYIKKEWDTMSEVSKEKYYQMASEVYDEDKNLLFPEIREINSYGN